MEVDNPLGNDLTPIIWSRRQNVGNAEKARGFVEVVDVVTIVVVAMEAVVDLLQPLAELTLLPLLELQLHMSANVIKKKDFVTSATRRDTDFFSARSLKARRR
jgi:hypothetical protein